MQSSPSPIDHDLVLIGGGHSHAIVLQMWAMQPLPGVRLTLISEDGETPYSGMLPGHVAGVYTHDECHIDLRSLCQWAGAQFYHDRVVGLDLVNQQVICADRPPVGFDILSINIGSTPSVPAISKTTNSIAAKPVAGFLAWWNTQIKTQAKLQLSLVGGGIGSVELALAMQHRLQPLVKQLELRIVGRSPRLLPTFEKLLTDRGVVLHLGETVTGWDGAALSCASGLQFASDAVIWVTQATAPEWLRQSGLAVDAGGFVQVDEYLRSVSHSQVFAAGDIAAMMADPRPKAGVFAVRQGKPLFDNLRLVILGQPLIKYKPQRRYLSLIGTADASAVAVRGRWVASSPLFWRWKESIDRRFMARFVLDQSTIMTEPIPLAPLRKGGQDSKSSFLSKSPFLKGDLGGSACSGCGAKVGSDTLSRTLNRIRSTRITNDSVLLGLDSPDDAAVLQVPAGQVLVQTIDYFPAIVDDPFLFGQIAANHSLSDLFAMGAEARSVLAMVTLPYGIAAKQEETLFQLLSGALKTLGITQTALVGGHTIEGEKLLFGLACNGYAEFDRLLKKSGMQPGNVLILTKPLGTGTLFAAQMRGLVKTAWVEGAIAMMLQSNFVAANIFRQAGATACTDVTGFGLLGHLREMVKASQVAVQLNLAALPMLAGARETTQRGIVSSLYAQNQQAALASIVNITETIQHPDFPLLFDPQTSGGLLASVSIEQSPQCLAQLHAAGYTQSCAIGVVTAIQANPMITIKS
jgi:selenide, water dikinase